MILFGGSFAILKLKFSVHVFFIFFFSVKSLARIFSFILLGKSLESLMFSRLFAVHEFFLRNFPLYEFFCGLRP